MTRQLVDPPSDDPSATRCAYCGCGLRGVRSPGFCPGCARPVGTGHEAWAIEEPSGPARCPACAYTLEGLPSPGLCPECGRTFDLDDESTFTRRPPFLRWTFWAPGLLTSLVTGTVLFVVLTLGMGNWGWAMWIATPVACGVILGYRVRTVKWALPFVYLALAAGLILALMSLSLAGAFCGLCLAAIFLVPIAVGGVVGAIFRNVLKQSGFSQRSYLPVLLAAVMPLAWGALEGPAQPGAAETVVTTEVIDAPAAACWDGIVFYEEVRHRPPLILRIGLAHPLFAVGSSRRAGDVKTCVYNKGWITKRVTEASPGRLLAFEVISQSIGYERDVRLTGGAFEFRELADARTEVRLSTTYEPRLTPRFAWRPFESLGVHTLHRHVIRGMRMNAAEVHVRPIANLP